MYRTLKTIVMQMMQCMNSMDVSFVEKGLFAIVISLFFCFYSHWFFKQEHQLWPCFMVWYLFGQEGTEAGEELSGDRR